MLKPVAVPRKRETAALALWQETTTCFLWNSSRIRSLLIPTLALLIMLVISIMPSRKANKQKASVPESL